MSALRKVVYLADDKIGEKETMRFRLTYEGPLGSSQGDARGGQNDRKAAQKQAIRKALHPQLRELWRTNKFLKEFRVFNGTLIQTHVSQVAQHGAPFNTSVERPSQSLAEFTADQYHEFGYKWVPLVREEWDLSCALDILFLRRDPPGSVISAGDLDNRLKTLVDGLRKPKNQGELGGRNTPDADEDPFYCLLEEDKDISAFSVESDTLLDPIEHTKDLSWARVIITVEIKPYHATTFALSFS